MTHDPCIEWAPFLLAEGISEETLLRASATLQDDFLSLQPGFRRRELLRGPGGRQWVDFVVWKDRLSADAALARVAQSPACHAYFQLMVQANLHEPGAGVLHLQQVAVYDGMRSAA